MLLFLFFVVAESALLGSLVPTNHTSTGLLKTIMADPKKFVAEVSKVDPGELANIISLLEALLETSENQEQDLVDHVADESQKALQSAEVLADAQTAVDGAQGDVEDAQAALALREQEHQAASDAHDAQEGAKALAEQELADLEGGLNSEQEVIRQVIAMLQGLQSSNCVEVVGDGETEQTPTCSWSNNCVWDETTQGECASHICTSSGYASGEFLSATNNPCEASWHSGSHWYYVIDNPSVIHGSPNLDASATVSCCN